MTKSEKIEVLLHATRSADCSFETLHELSQEMRHASQDELELAFRNYILKLFTAWVAVAQDKINAQELQECGGRLH